MRRRRAERAPVTHCPTCHAPAVDVICLDGLDRRGCAACEPDLVCVALAVVGVEPVYLERKVVLLERGLTESIAGRHEGKPITWRALFAKLYTDELTTKGD